MLRAPVVMPCSHFSPPSPPCSLGFHHCHAAGQPQQLLQPLDLPALHRPPLPRPRAALPLLLVQLPEGPPAQRDERQQKEQLIHLRPEPGQLQPEGLLAAIRGVTGGARTTPLGLDCTTGAVWPLVVVYVCV